MNFFLLILFHRVNADSFNIAFDIKKIMNSLQPTNEENNIAQRATCQFTWFYEKDHEKTLTRFNEAWNFVRKLYTLLTF